MNRDIIICGDNEVINPLEYDKRHDVAPVEQDGFVDLVSALANNSVPSDISATDDSYNGIDEPSSILGKPRDVFQAAHVRETIANYTPPNKNVE